MKRLFLHLGIAVLSLFIGLAFAEIALRLSGWSYHPMKIDASNVNDARFHHAFEDDHFRWDPVLFWRPEPQKDPFNRQGFRGPEIAPQSAPGEQRIFAVGDSNTLGWAGEDGANWPAELQAQLAPRCPGCTVINAGVWGYTSHQGRARLEDVAPFHPALVLVSFGANDGHPVERSDREFAERAARWQRIPLHRHLRLSELLFAALEGPAPAGRALRPRVDLDAYRENLVAMIERIRALGATPVLLTRPYIGENPEGPWWKKAGSDYNVATATTAASEGALLIDLFTAFRGADELFHDESHFTAEGHRRAGALVARALLPDLSRRGALGAAHPAP